MIYILWISYLYYIIFVFRKKFFYIKYMKFGRKGSGLLTHKYSEKSGVIWFDKLMRRFPGSGKEEPSPRVRHGYKSFYSFIEHIVFKFFSEFKILTNLSILYLYIDFSTVVMLNFNYRFMLFMHK